MIELPPSVFITKACVLFAQGEARFKCSHTDGHATSERVFVGVQNERKGRVPCGVLVCLRGEEGD